MGRKSREKQLRRLGLQDSARPQAQSGGRAAGGIPWLLGTVIVAAILVGSLVFLFQANKPRIIQAAVLATSTQVESQLQAARGKFSFETSRELSRIIGNVRALAANPNLDARNAGQLQFVLKAMEEVIQEGNLRPEELGKLQDLTGQVQRHLQKLQPQQRPPKS